MARDRPDASGSELTAAIDALAGKFAAMRSRAPVGRVARMSVSDRTSAYGYMLALMFGLEDELARRSAAAASLERMLGLRSGRQGGLAATLASTLDEVQPLVGLPTPDEAASASAHARDDELEVVRWIVDLIKTWAPSFLKLLVAEHGPRAEPFAILARGVFDDPHPGFLPVVILSLLVHLRRARRQTRTSVACSLLSSRPRSTSLCYASCRAAPAARRSLTYPTNGGQHLSGSSLQSARAQGILATAGVLSFERGRLV